ncbi:hypothetical protein EDC44_1552 [Cricetibacter osteomyelitidis]|uniref:SH3 domain-containing protein n=1 Tax=Cricetibacter osteomyelitidis TaxID=1521931 RepID=A0A4R2SEZ7_9PAST|nr:hypothetical protein [Cricetibacter osteomyelitidis]TCP88147.1 hypothetical protein EDC44_1552 [Cricetibacter osteomyelitidis]
MRRVNYLLFGIFFLIFNKLAMADNLSNVNNCLYTELPYGDGYNVKVLFFSNKCELTNDLKTMVQLMHKNKVVNQTDKAFPLIISNNEYGFEGERDIRMENGMLEIEIAKPNRNISEAYSIIFFFKVDGELITFDDYKINDLCYIPEEELCPRVDKLKENSRLHRIMKEFLYGINIFDFDTNKIYQNIYDVWQEGGIYLAVKTDKAYLYNKPNKITKGYLINNDKVKVLAQEIDSVGIKWYFINYKGKKDINMWIKAEDVDLKEK